MPSENYCQVFNPTYQTSAEFHLFPRLPAEVRHLIWTLSLQRGRVICISLQRTDGWVSDPDDEGSKGYRTIVRPDQGFSKLLRINKESRSIALKFYRLHLPGCFTNRGPAYKPGIFYVNPEHDVIQVETPCLAEVFNRFLLDFRKLDPKGVGLVNLSWEPDGLDHLVRLLAGNQSQYALFGSGIAQVRRVHFVAKVRDHRAYWDKVHFGRWNLIGRRTVNFNNSLPVKADPITFDYLGPDPRPIGQDLCSVFAGKRNPLACPAKWLGLLREVGFEASHPIDYRVKLLFDPGRGKDIVTHTSAETWLRHDHDAYAKAVKLRTSPLPSDLQGEIEVQENHEVKPVFGFWLFPLAAFGDVPGPDLDLVNFLRASDGNAVSRRHGGWLDLSDHWPELCIYSLT